MKRYTAMKNDTILKDEDGDNVSFKAASSSDNIVVWMTQIVGDLNRGFVKGPYWIKVEQI